ncbi:uncharacterized protein LACBIDRAFT_334434 [Laccaria bicolor S238N-H82]|uniref:Predicted protein n=1 Tax=Laccaria bicolor (strain S238N-H82 / ATCC MYA-4686) TaxID=486041 RepID=B0DZ73_LACBS|nr:uncharacterized protein LACBIDRAFT_334434 [Laccaria bicolor S238N-H82]EDR00188.1 predicted protein [Laccaria bicolor S238N-H82]|eukprot:XP_001889245.1 predicted protein [Laccaria bicolor S238N-H82]
MSSRFDATFVDPNVLDVCPGYKATDVSASKTKFTATLVLAGKPCNVFGNNIQISEIVVEHRQKTGLTGLNWSLQSEKLLNSYLSPPPSRLNGHAKIASKRTPSHSHSLPAATKSLPSNKGLGVWGFGKA